MRALIVNLAVAAAVFVGGCASDPCNGVTSGTCITLRVLPGNGVSTLDQITVDSEINGTHLFKQSPDAPTGNTYDLPFDMALIYPAGQSGAVQLTVQAASNDQATALGTTAFMLTAGQHQLVQVTLDSPPGSGTNDMGTSPQNGDMSALQATAVVKGSFAGFAASASLIAAVTASTQTLQIYDYPSGTLKVTLDANVDPQLLYVSDSIVLYCANPTAIGTTTLKSCTLKSWKPGDTSAILLGSGVYPFEPRVSNDGTVLGWTENVNSTATTVDEVTWFSGSKTTLATTMPIGNAGGLIANNVAFAIVPSATAGQFDIVRQSSSASIVHICVDCDQLVLKNDGSQIAARSSPTAGGPGKLVVGATSINSMNGLGTSTMGSSTADVASLIDYFDGGSVMYFATSGAGFNIREWAESSNLVTTRLGNGSAKGFWEDNGTLLGYYTTLDSNSVGDLWTLTALTGAPTLFDSGGQMYDLTADGRFTFTKMPSTDSSTWTCAIGGTGATVPPTVKAPCGNARIVNPTRVGYFDGTTSYAIADYVTGSSYQAENVLETYPSLALKRILFLFSGSGDDGIFAYTY